MGVDAKLPRLSYLIVSEQQPTQVGAEEATGVRDQLTTSYLVQLGLFCKKIWLFY